MYSLFGDYRKKMQEDQKQQGKEPAVNPRLSVVKQKEQRSLFVKVSQNKSAGSDRQEASDQEDVALKDDWKFQKSDNNFRFNFGVNAETS